MTDDEYSRVDYRRIVAWPSRIQREEPFLRRVLGAAPRKSVLDLGCGSGEHSRFLAGLGFRVLGIDRSESMLERATEDPVPERVEFVRGDMTEVDRFVSEPFGAAICLGNTLAHLNTPGDMIRFLESLRKSLAERGVFLFQILNYERISEQGIRYLPLNFREEETGEIVFLRLMKTRGDGTVLFCPSTLELDSDREEPLKVLRSRRVRLRGWKRPEIVELLEQTGWQVREVMGDMEGGPYSLSESQDLVVAAVRTDEDPPI